MQHALHHVMAISNGDEYCNLAEIPAAAVTVAFWACACENAGRESQIRVDG